MEKITIERLGHQGDGIAPGPIFVARALPGEVIQGVIENGRIATAKIITPVPERVRPACRHYKNCGGCSLQHASDEFVKNWKKNVVETALQAQGLPAPIRGIHTSPSNARRRATLAARRLKKGAQVGFYGLKSDTISEIDDCRLLRPELLRLLPLVGDFAQIGASRKARLAVTLTLLDDGVDIAVKGGKPMTRALFTELTDLARQAGQVARLSWEGDVIASFSKAELALGRAKVSPPPGAFLQATQDGERALLAAVKRAVGPAKHIADLFAGSGTFALPLAEGASVHAVEGSSEMTKALSAGWRGATGLKAVTTETRDLFARPLLPDELQKFDAVVIDPPRAGAEAQVSELAKTQIGRITLVSCNPVTFARDARILTEAGFNIDWIEVVDQFRWSQHVEVVASLSRGK